MDNSWDFLKKSVSKGEQEILIDAMRACDIKVNTYEEAIKECENMYNDMSYLDMLKKMSESLNISLNQKDLESDRLMIGHIGYFLLAHDESFRRKIASLELMPKDKKGFKLKYFLELETSEVFWFKIAMYVFWYYHMSVVSLTGRTDETTFTTDIISKAFVTSVLPFAFTGWASRVIGGGLRGAMFTNALIPGIGFVLGGLGGLVATSIYGINKLINTSFVNKLPIHFTIIYLHLTQSYELSTITEVKSLLRTAIMNANPKNVQGKYDWDDVRKGILQRIAPQIPVYDKKVVNQILSNQILIPSTPLETYIPQNILNQIFKFDLKELIDFIYAFDVSNAVKSVFLNRGFDNKHVVLFVDYCFPYTPIDDFKYCLLSKDEVKSSLAQLYYEFNGLNSKKLCLKNINRHFDFVQLYDPKRFNNSSKRNRYLFDSESDKYHNRIKKYCKHADKVAFISKNCLTIFDVKEDEINRLKNEILSLKQRVVHLEDRESTYKNLEQQIKDQDYRCDRVKHDLEHLLSDIITPIKRYVKYKDNPKIQNEAVEKFKKSIEKYDILCDSWKILNQKDMHGELKEISIKEISKIFENFDSEIDHVKLTLINLVQEDNFNVYVSEHFKLQVLNNIISNLEEHAFVNDNGDRKLYISISHDDLFVTISIENNGCPIETDNIESLFEYRLPNKKGIGLSNIRDSMRYAKGDFQIESNRNSEYCTIYKLTFKIINLYEKNTLA